MNQNKQKPQRHINPDHLALVLIAALAGVFLITVLLAVIIPKQTTPSELTKAEQAEQNDNTSSKGGKAASYTADTQSDNTAVDNRLTDSKKEDESQTDSSQSENDNRNDTDQEENSTDTSSLSSLGSYEVNINDHLSADVSITEGSLVVTAEDSEGNVTTVLNEKGPYQNSSFICQLPSGQYQINIYGNASGWKFSFTAQ